MALFGKSGPSSSPPPRASPPSPGASPEPPPDPFALDAALCSFTPNDVWTIGDACEGTQIFGATGSGKTSGSGAALARAFLKAGFGGLVLTVKPDERKLWKRYAEETGRGDDLVMFGIGTGARFNFLDYEATRASRGAGLTENLINLFTTTIEAAGPRGGREDPFWQYAQRQLLRNAIDTVLFATGTVSLRDIVALIKSAPQDVDAVRGPHWEQGRCFALLKAAHERTDLSPEELRDFDQAFHYWTGEFPALSSKTRSIIVTSFTAMADCLTRRPAYELFCTETTAPPEITHAGKILLLDLPVKEFGDVGRFAQLVYKYLWQRATEIRDVQQNPRPVFLWADESQFFLTSHDQLFQTTARAARACTVYLTQSISNYYAAMGGEHSQAAVDSFLGNLQTKIFHANGDPRTNTWAADVIGKTWRNRGTMNMQGGGSFTESLDHQVDPITFTQLAKGGPRNEWRVGGVVFQGGRVWNTNRNYLLLRFAQRVS